MRIPSVAADQAGLLSRHQALSAATSRGAFDRVRRSGTLVRLSTGVYAADSPTPLDGRSRHLVEARATLLSLGEPWCLARRTAAVLYGLPLLGQAPSEVQLTRPRSTKAVRSSSRHRHINALPEAEQQVHEGMACTTLARTVFDLARRESRASALVVVDAALRSGLTREELASVVESHRGWPGTRQARWAVALGDARAESPLESLGRLACVEEDLPVFEPQVEVWLDGELLGRVDGLWRERLVVFEGDGASKFDGPGVLPALLRRQELLREAGLPVVRASWADLTRRRAQWAAGVRRALADSPGRPVPGVRLVRTSPRPVPLDTTDHYRWPPSTPLSTQHPAWGSGEVHLARGVA